MKTTTLFIIIALIGLGVGFFWDNIPAIKQSAHALLDPTLGVLLNTHLVFGFLAICAVFSLITTLLQKYTTDQKMLKEIREEQKFLQSEMKKYRDNPEKVMEINKRSMELMSKMFPLTMRPALYTSIPIILFFRWFGDYFTLYPSKILGMHWLLAYIIFSIVFSSIFRKMFKVH